MHLDSEMTHCNTEQELTCHREMQRGSGRDVFMLLLVKILH